MIRSKFYNLWLKIDFSKVSYDYHFGENDAKAEFGDTKGVIRIRLLKKDRQHNGQKKEIQKDQQRSTKHAHKAKDQETRTSLQTGGKFVLLFNALVDRVPVWLP